MTFISLYKKMLMRCTLGKPLCDMCEDIRWLNFIFSQWRLKFLDVLKITKFGANDFFSSSLSSPLKTMLDIHNVKLILLVEDIWVQVIILFLYSCLISFRCFFFKKTKTYCIFTRLFISYNLTRVFDSLTLMSLDFFFLTFNHCFFF